jgi:molybdopterin converting factor small subunit
MAMKVELKCFATLVDPETCDYRSATAYELADGKTVQDLAELAGVDGEKVKIAFVNGRQAAIDTPLADGDRIGLVPAVGGM